jgi:hypothetical protein
LSPFQLVTAIRFTYQCLRCKNLLIRRTFRPRRDEITGEWRRLHNEELNDLYCSPNTIRVIKTRRMRWAGHVSRMEERRGVYKVFVRKPEGDNLGDPGVDGRITLRCILRK